MDHSDTMLEIQTLGCFSISVDGKPVAAVWPDETQKELFCSLLSPLDLSFPYDRICRSMWGVPATPASRRRLEESIIRPLISFLTSQLGFNPLITGNENIRIDHQHIHVDARVFHSTVVEGLRLLSLGKNAAAFADFNRARSLYAGDYLPGMHGTIIEHTRSDLESLYKSVFIDDSRSHGIPAVLAAA
jgi:hypothetical protein